MACRRNICSPGVPGLRAVAEALLSGEWVAIGAGVEMGASGGAVIGGTGTA